MLQMMHNLILQKHLSWSSLLSRKLLKKNPLLLEMMPLSLKHPPVRKRHGVLFSWIVSFSLNPILIEHLLTRTVVLNVRIWIQTPKLLACRIRYNANQFSGLNDAC
jgi:hypothetical protein